MDISKNRLFFTVVFSAFFITANAQENKNIQRVEPTFWWVGMENPNVQLLVYGPTIGDFDVSVDYSGVTINSARKVENNNYLFLDLSISRTVEPGTFQISFTDGKKKFDYPYELKSRVPRRNMGQGIDASDAIYLITPDRFANGNPTNDSTEDTLEKADKNDPNGRHGGDLKGIIDHFDYLKELGVTTLWLNPVLENDQAAYSYHGYGISDFYKVDSRFGSNEGYKQLVDLCHENGMKVIMDQVFNHCGSGHWWMDDLPTSNWLNQWEVFTRSNFTNIAASDPHVSKSDYKQFTKGWFDTNLPDLNLENKLLETYVIQNSVWWIEYSGIDGIRMDTYPYPNKEAMAHWLQVLELEYPGFFMVAETWAKRASYISYWNNRGTNSDGYTPHVKSASDYPLYYAIIDAFKNGGDVYTLYETLAEDFIYGQPNNNKVFNGNHDVDRLLALLDMDVDKLKLSMAFTLTTRGIPQIYYGDEILMKNKKPDGELREDFPGGWYGDQRNAFNAEGRTAQENDMFDYVKTILNWRKTAKAVHQGKLTHYQPIENVYVYFRHTDKENTMVIINNGKKEYKDYSLVRFQESLQGYTNGTDIIQGKKIDQLKSIPLPQNTALIIDLYK